MPQPDTEVDLDALIAAQIAAISGAGLGLAAVAYQQDRREFAEPTCMVRVADFERADDIGTEQLPMLARFEAHIIVGFRTPSVMTAAPKMALAVAHLIERNRFGQRVQPAEVSVVEPDEFAPDLDQFVVWRVDYQQVIHIGASIWDNEGTIPTQILSSWAPEVGPDNEGAYTEVET